jgi:hypothetical protein
MATTVEDSSRRVIGPIYDFDPDGVYAAWTTYYTQDSTNEAGSIHFTSVPGLKSESPGEQTGSTVISLSAALIDSSQNDSNEHVVLHKFETALPDELNVKAGEVVGVLHSFNDGWSLVKGKKGEVGMVPSQCLVLRELAPKVPGSTSSVNIPVSNIQCEGIQRASISDDRDSKYCNASAYSTLDTNASCSQPENPGEKTGSIISPSATPLIGSSQKDSNEYVILHNFEQSLPNELIVKAGEVVTSQSMSSISKSLFGKVYCDEVCQYMEVGIIILKVQSTPVLEAKHKYSARRRFCQC